ncbi:MAG TPA: hypothetical protein VGP94_14285, partial [Tepidisphaeraceae bacterium]|nr:hypothetical protein [Tepidisphaeraceae bacterium]
MSDRASVSIRGIIATAVVLLFIIAFAFWGWHSLHKTTGSPQISRQAGVDSSLAAGRAPASVRGAVLYDCYEHARENVPPRNDTSQRANAWQPPPMPMDIIRAAASSKGSASDGELIEFLKSWESAYRSGKNLDDVQRAQLSSLLEQTKLPFEMLFNLGATMGFLENVSVGALFHRAALSRAAEDYKDLSPLHPAAPMLRVALPQMGMYWSNGDYPLLEQRFRIEMQLYPPLSQEGRKCMHSCAEAMYYQGQRDQAADLIASKVQHDEQAADLTASDKQEMGWIVGIFYGEDRAKEAIAGLAVAGQSGGSRTSNALSYMAMRISRLPPPDMEQQLAALDKFRMSPQQIEQVRAQATAMAARRPPTPTTRQAMTIEQRLAQRRAMEVAASQPTTRPAMMSIEQRLAARRATEYPASQPTTRPTLTPQQLALLEATRAALATSRPSTRPAPDAAALQRQREYQQMLAQQRSAAAKQAEDLVPELRALLQSNPRQAVDRLLNRGGLAILMQARRYDDLEALAVPAIVSASRDTWQMEQLQRFRVAAFNEGGKSNESLAAARAQFNVAGMGSVPNDLTTIATALRGAFPNDQAIVNRFKLQQLAGAQSNSEQRKKLLAELGESVMGSIQVDGTPFKDA